MPSKKKTEVVSAALSETHVDIIDDSVLTQLEQPRQVTRLQYAFIGERAIPFAENQKNWAWVMRDHLHRYVWAMEHCVRATVADLGCGTGYGAHWLSFLAESVIGIDLSEKAINFARHHFAHDGLTFEVGDLNNPLPAAQVYVCFEVLEHLDNPRDLINRLPEGSVLLWSFPVSDPGQFHKHVLDVAGIEDLMAGSEFRYQLDGGNIVAERRTDAKYVLGVLRK